MALFISLMDFEAVPAVWHYLFFYGIWNFSESLALLVFHFYSGLWNCSDSVTLLVFLLGFGRVPLVWHYLFFYWTLELFRQCGIICYLEKPVMPHCLISSKVQ
jgi:hypothetical protein